MSGKLLGRVFDSAPSQFFLYIIVLGINRQGDISNNLNLHFSNDFQLKTAKNMNNNMYLIFPIKSIKFFKNIITSKNEILCAEAGTSFAAEGSEYFWSSFTVFMQIRLGTLRYYLLLWSLQAKYYWTNK
jgi:hypothetical protein